MSKTFRVEWTEKLDDNTVLIHQKQNNLEKIITHQKVLESSIPGQYIDWSGNIYKNIQQYNISDDTGKQFIIIINNDNDKILKKQIIFSNIKRTIYYVYDSDDTLLYTAQIIGDLESTMNMKPIYTVYSYTDIDNPYFIELTKLDSTKVIKTFNDSDGSITTVSIDPDRPKLVVSTNDTIKYGLMYNNDIIMTNIDTNLKTINNNRSIRSIEFTLDKFTYKIIWNPEKKRVKLILKTNNENELTLSDKFF